MPQTIEFSIEQGDITSFDSDVIAIKYAQDFYGADKKVKEALSKVGLSIDRPEAGNYSYLETRDRILARRVLCVPVLSMQVLKYQDIQEFATKVLNILADVAPDTKHLAMTIHGVGGQPWDPVEALLAQFAGYLGAIQSGRLPSALERISVVEINSDRVQLLRQAPKTGAALVSALQNIHAHVRVRSSAARSLGPLGQASPEIISALRRALQDPDEGVRSEVERSLRQLGQDLADPSTQTPAVEAAQQSQTPSAPDVTPSDPISSPRDVNATKLARETMTEAELPREAVQQKATSDVPTQDMDKDKLGFKDYVCALREFIASPETSTPLTIGIYGAWGSGKSSLMYMLKNELDPELNFWSRLWLRRLWLKWFLTFLIALIPWLFGKFLIWVDDRMGSMGKFRQAHVEHLNDPANPYRAGGPEKFREVRKKLVYDASESKGSFREWLQNVCTDLSYDPTEPGTDASTNAPDSNQAAQPNDTNSSQSNNTGQLIDTSKTNNPAQAANGSQPDNPAQPGSTTETEKTAKRNGLPFWQWVGASHYPILPPTHPTVWFNAWKFDQEEQLWAALALEVLDQIKRKYNIFQRIIFWFRLMLKRFSLAALWSVVTTVALPLLFGLIYWIYTSYMKQLPNLSPLQVIGFQIPPGQLLLGAGIVVSALIQILKIAKDPFQLQMKNVFDKPNYKDKIGFIGDFQDDFARIVSLVTEPRLGWQPRKLVIFIDDLDRCEPPKAVDIIEGINLFLDSQGCVFVLGMDPAAVAASIENKYKDLFEKMRREDMAVVSPGMLFLDKIIQVPFHVPQTIETKIGDLIADIMQPKTRVPLRRIRSIRPANIRNGKNAQNGRQVVTPPTPDSTPPTTKAENAQLITDDMQSQRPSLRTGPLPSSGTGSSPAPGSTQTAPASGPSIHRASYKLYKLKDIQNAIEEGARFLPENPRQVKKYMNLFRFYVYIAHQRKLTRFREEGADGADKEQIGLTLNRLAIWVAWSVRWSEIAQSLSEEVQTVGMRNYLLLISKVLKKDGDWCSIVDAVKEEPEFGNSTLFPMEAYERWKYREPVYEKLVGRISRIRQIEQNALSHWSHLPWEWWLLDLDFRKGVKEMESFWKKEDENDWLGTVLTWTRIAFSTRTAIPTTGNAKSAT
jgi:hypothetical protein